MVALAPIAIGSIVCQLTGVILKAGAAASRRADVGSSVVPTMIWNRQNRCHFSSDVRSSEERPP